MRDIDVTRMFEPEVILPSQLDPRASYDKPELNLWSSVLLDGVCLYLGIKRVSNYTSLATHRRAVSWVEDARRTGVGSFDWMCAALGIEASSFRDQLMRSRWKRSAA